MAKQTNETIKFGGFSGYYGSIAQGYGGMEWGDVDYLNATYWQKVQTNWCDTGYQNVIKGAGEAFTWYANGSVSYGLLESANLNETFSLVSMVAASAWETHQAFEFKTYTFKVNHGFILKASDTIHLSQTAQTLNFAKIGKPGDFTNIASVTIISGSGKYGNTCSYGPYGYTLGNEMAFDNLKVKWNGKIPKGNGQLVTTGLATHGHGHAHVAAPQLVYGNAHHEADSSATGQATGHSGPQADFHSELLSLGDSGSGGLTAQFHLPAVEHFGT